VKYKLIILFLSFSALLFSQEDKKKNSSKVAKESAVLELSRSLEEEKPDIVVAADYEKAAKEMSAKGDYGKAQEYLNKARQLYVKLSNKDKIAEIDRELAKNLESQNKFDEAIISYQSASKLQKGKTEATINANDAQRLMNQSDPRARGAYIQQNISALENTSNKDDLAAAYQQMAEVNLEMADRTEAISNLQQALLEVKDKPEEVIKINRNIANVYAEEQQYEKAIDINKKMIAEAKKTENPKIEIEQLQELSSVYLKSSDTIKSISALREAYDLAVDKGHTLDAKNSLIMLAGRYNEDNDQRKIIDLYSDFINKLEPMIKSDTSLIDNQLLQVNEEKITRLEKERELKDQLIKKKNIFNYVLIGSIILVLIFLVFVAKALYSIKKKNKKIALQSLRREMNPHFIFNSLNSVNQFIAQNNELEANKYLSSYSKLMRNIMENSNKDFIPLSVEIDQLKEYLELEHMRFRDKFTYCIDIDSSLDADAISVPNMIIQPQLENAIWHGLRYKEGEGLLTLSFMRKDDIICIRIEDDGIGLTKSKELKTKHQKAHTSRGLTNTRERIALLNNLYDTNITMEIKEKYEEKSGVIVTICFPLTKTDK